MQRPVTASVTMRAPIDQAKELLGTDPAVALVDHASVDERRSRTFRSTLSAPIGSGGVHHEVDIEAGLGRIVDDGAVVPLTWRAAGHKRLFPTFDGALEVTPQGSGSLLVVRGTYRVPLGPLGRLGEGLAGRTFAQESLRVFVERAGARLDAEIARRRESIAVPTVVYPESLREHDR